MTNIAVPGYGAEKRGAILGKRGLWILVLAIGAALLPVSPALAATITVTTTADETTINGLCSLREAINAANSNEMVDTCAAGQHDAFDAVLLNSGSTYVLDETGDDDSNAGGDLDIFDADAGDPMGNVEVSTTETAPAYVTQTVTNQRVFHVDPPSTAGSAQVNLHQLIISGGNGSVSGAGIYNDGGSTNVQLFQTRVTSNSAGSGQSGGGILNEGTLGLDESEIYNNTAGNMGGGISNSGTLSVSESTIAENYPGADGGGIFVTAGTVTVGNSTISSNQAGRHGGGIYTTGGNTTVTDSTIHYNTADANTSATANGDGGGIHRNLGTISLQGTILGGNFDSTAEYPNCIGGFTSFGYNLVDSNTTCIFTPAGGDVTLAPPEVVLLDALEVNHTAQPFATRTHVPVAASPAIDAAEASSCAPGNVDQRGISRPQGPACDIGAVEVAYPTNDVNASQPGGAFNLKRKIRVAWPAVSDPVGVERYEVEPRRSDFKANDFTIDPLIVVFHPSVSTDVQGDPGSTHCFKVRYRNGDHQEGPFGDEACTALPINDDKLKEKKNWQEKNCGGCYLGDFSQAKTKGSKLTAENVKDAKTIALVATKCDGCGKVKVMLGSNVLKKINLDANNTQKKKLIPVEEFGSPRDGALNIVVTTSGKPVKIEGLGVSKV